MIRTTEWKKLFLALFFLVLSSAGARADVTLRSTSSGKGMGVSSGGETITYIKGKRMRTDTGGESTSTILDLDSQSMIILDHKKKRAEFVSMEEISEQLSEISDSDVKVDVRRSGQSRQILDQECEEYLVTIRIAFALDPNEPVQMVMSGSFWVAPRSPGKEDVERFFTAAAEKGMFFGDPRIAKAQPGQAKGMTELYRAMAEAGVAYLSEIKIGFEGSGMMAQMMGRMGGSTITNELKSVSTEALADSLFEVPADYKIKK